MSISDFTLTSPRKSNLKNRSITYDEEFEKFLNDTSESDVSMTKYVKQSNEKPWWLNDDDDDEKGTKESKNEIKKSFMKQKPTPQAASPTKLYASTLKLTTTIEDDNEQNDSKYEEKPKHIDLPKLSIENSSYSMNHFEEDTKKSIKSLSEDQNDYDDEKDIYSNESTTENALSSPESKISVVDRIKQVIIPDTNEKKYDPESTLLKTQLTTNLLSKVMFMDSLTSGEAANNTLLKTNDKLNVTQRQVQISDTTKTINLNNDTQTRHDLDALEQVYRNLTTTDSGLNTLIKTNQPSADQSLVRPIRSYDNSREMKNSNSINSEIGLQAVHAITAELENRALDQILKELKNNSKQKKNVDFNISTVRSSSKENLSTDKYKHIKSTGYGKSWSPSPYNGHLKNSLSKDLNRISIEQESKSIVRPKSPLKQNTKSIETKSAESKLLKDNEIYIISLKNQIIKRESDHQNLIRELRTEYEQQINELKSHIEYLKSQTNTRKSLDLTEKNDDKKSQSDETNIEKVKELERLIKGYQQENERLYSELKRIKEKNKSEVKNLTEQISNLKFSLIQEKITFENQVKQEENKENILNVSSLNKINDSENEIKLLKESLSKYEAQIKSLNEKLSYYEKNQRQIELDIKLIDSKNVEIKKLNNKLKQLELGKTPVDCLKQIKNLKNQIKEMDGLIRRLKQPVMNNSQQNDVNISINFYEQKIKELEEELLEKDMSLKRLNRFWEQKFNVYQQTLKRTASASPNSHMFSSSKRDLELEKNYLEKIQNLEDLTKNLRKKVYDLEAKIDEKENELNRVKLEKNARIEALNKQIELNRPLSKPYEPREFLSLIESPKISDNFELIKEIESLKLKLQKLENESKIMNREFDFEMKQIKLLYENKISDLIRKHKQEIEKLIQVFTGYKISPEMMSDEFLFSDPVQLKLLLSARDQHTELKKTIEKQKFLLKKFHQQLNEQNIFREKCLYLEDENKKLNEKIADLKQEESFIKGAINGDTTIQLKQYEFLKEKIKNLESKLYKRDKDLDSILSRDESSLDCSVISSSKLSEIKKFYEHQLELKNKEIYKFRLEFDAMIQLLHSL